MRIQILGQVRAWRDGEQLDLGPTAQRAVLGLLALACGQPVRTAEISAVVWPDRSPPPSARNVIQTHIKHLRRRLEPDRPPRAPSQVLRQVGDGYALQLPNSAVDALRFRDLLTAATGRQRAGDLRRAADELEEALALWQGPPMADIPDLTAHPRVVTLVEERHAALARYGEIMIASGRAAEAVPALEEAATAQPLDEAAQARLIRAYQAAGQRARAFHTYHQVRHRLTDELGVDPGPELSAAHTTLLHDEDPVTAGAGPAPTGAQRTDQRDTRTAPAAPAQLPADIPDFTGRGTELARLDNLLDATEPGGDTVPGVTLVATSGTAGVGKTALAIRWAHRVRHRFPDGQLYVDLQGYDAGQPVSPGHALAGFLRALGVSGPDLPLDLDERAACYRSLVDGRRLLVVLDNAASAEQVRPLLPGSPSCFVLVTSRDSLAGLVARHGARRIDLDPLPLDEAVALIHRLIGARVTAEHTAAAVLAAQCARLPLALRVAAEMAATRPGAQLVELVRELADQHRRLDLLDAGGDLRTGVRAVFSWSYLHLPTDAARAFRLLGLHPGPGLEPYAAAAVIGTTVADARRLLDLLARAHLLERGPQHRYGMHDLLRAYAVDLAEAQDAPVDRHRSMTALFDHYLHTAAAAMDLLYPAERHRRPAISGPTAAARPLADAASGRSWLEQERANLVAIMAYAAGHGWPEHARRLVLTVFRYLEGAGHYPDAVTAHHHGLLAAEAIGDRDSQAHMMTNIAVVYGMQGHRKLVVDHLQRALVLYRQTGERAGEARALGNLGVFHGQQGQYDQAREHLQEALALLRATGETHGEAMALGNLGWIHVLQGRYAEAGEHLDRAIILCRRIGHRVGMAFALDSFGQLHARLGRFRDAADHHGRALQIYRDTSQPVGQASALVGLADALMEVGNPAAAREHYQQALSIAAQIGDRTQQARAHAGLARAGQRLVDTDRAPAAGPGRTPDEVWDHWCHALSHFSAIGAPEAEQIRAHLAAVGRHRAEIAVSARAPGR
ncbi:BTAD domain-containing putative transcriptional regulator [Solwaraspora sp. WMMD791]|nr:BTAD domain-containing putative transcriptional regulator [Solwaraspora sp. WMMD791]WFE28684.1 BTAD domain-containing putative transcriptional regulator [Solwaraspora sp. WMMD791]